MVPHCKSRAHRLTACYLSGKNLTCITRCDNIGQIDRQCRVLLSLYCRLCNFVCLCGLLVHCLQGMFDIHVFQIYIYFGLSSDRNGTNNFDIVGEVSKRKLYTKKL